MLARSAVQRPPCVLLRSSRSQQLQRGFTFSLKAKAGLCTPRDAARRPAFPRLPDPASALGEFLGAKSDSGCRLLSAHWEETGSSKALSTVAEEHCFFAESGAALSPLPGGHALNKERPPAPVALRRKLQDERSLGQPAALDAPRSGDLPRALLSRFGARPGSTRGLSLTNAEARCPLLITTGARYFHKVIRKQHCVELQAFGLVDGTYEVIYKQHALETRQKKYHPSTAITSTRHSDAAAFNFTSRIKGFHPTFTSLLSRHQS